MLRYIRIIRLSREKVTNHQPRAFYKYAREIKSISPERSWSMRDAYSPRPRSFAFFFPPHSCLSITYARVARFAMGIIVSRARRRRKATVIPGLSMWPGTSLLKCAPRGWIAGRVTPYKVSRCRFHEAHRGEVPRGFAFVFWRTNNHLAPLTNGLGFIQAFIQLIKFIELSRMLRIVKKILSNIFDTIKIISLK